MKKNLKIASDNKNNNNNNNGTFFMITGERPLHKLGIKESFLNSLKGIYKYLIENMALNGKILKAKYLKLGKRWRSLALILLILLQIVPNEIKKKRNKRYN